MTLPSRTSFACDGVGGIWDWYTRDGQMIPIGEIVAESQRVEAERGVLTRNDFLALVRAKLKRAQEGRLAQPEDVKTNMARARGLHEIIWSVDEHHLWRLYYSEPLKLYSQRMMWGLHFHRKASLADQDAGIDEAARRHQWWYSNTPG